MADDLTERVARAYPNGPRDTARLLNHKADMRRAFADGARSERRAMADDVDGLAGVLRDHPDYFMRRTSPLDDWYCVGCNHEIETSVAHIEAEFRSHQAAMVAAYLRGGA